MEQPKHRHQERTFSPEPSSKIKHSDTTLGRPANQPQDAQQDSSPQVDLSSISVSDGGGAAGPKEIRALGMKTQRHEEMWSRTPNTPGTGAIHVKTFHCKVTEDGMLYMDQMINEWLDHHPQYEVKFVQTSIGTFTGKIKEPHVICQVWV